MSLILYNTLTNKEEEFTPLKEGKVAMYTCGPTVYGRPHIGNYSSFLMADLLRRWLEVSGYDVTHVKNITDVGHLVADADQGEDKVEKEAKKESVEPLDIAKKYTEQYLEDEKALNMLEPQHRPRATETIKEMIALVETLIKKGHAYETEDGVYFSVETFPEYGKLSGNTLENLSAGARIDVKEEKKHPADFALWKKCVGENADHILRWESPWGEGFPGWHIECSAMSTKFLGEELDIHTGGQDNIFPHHECEIAQSESAMNDITGGTLSNSSGSRGSQTAAGAGGAEREGYKPFVRYWVHRRRIDIASTGSAQGAQKMSKSLGNVLSIPDIIDKGISPLDLRYYFLSVHYRTHLKFSWKGLDDAHKARRKVLEWMQEASSWEASDKGVSADDVFEWRTKFAEAMNQDLNTPGALAVIFDCMSWSRNQKAWAVAGWEALLDFINDVRQTFGCFDPEEHEIPSEVQKLLDERQKARDAKDFEASDRLRDEIRTLGYEVRDVEGGQEAQRL